MLDKYPIMGVQGQAVIARRMRLLLSVQTAIKRTPTKIRSLMSDFKDDTCFLFADPSFLTGLAAVLDIHGNLLVYNTCRGGRDADERALASDWAVVGKDISAAIEAIEEEELQNA